MKRSGLWLAIAIMFSLPALGLAQATGGSPGKALENGATKGASGKKAVHAESHSKKGAKTSVNTAAQKLETPTKVLEDGTGRKGRQQPSTTARKKPPSPTTKPDKQ
jgi:hypothetical protein